VFTATDDGGVRFHPLPAPTDEEVARVLATIATRVRRLLRRRGLEAEEGRSPPATTTCRRSSAAGQTEPGSGVRPLLLSPRPSRDPLSASMGRCAHWPSCWLRRPPAH